MNTYRAKTVTRLIGALVSLSACGLSMRPSATDAGAEGSDASLPQDAGNPTTEVDAGEPDAGVSVAPTGSISPVRLTYVGASNINRPLHACLVRQTLIALRAPSGDELSPNTPVGWGRYLEVEPASGSSEEFNEFAERRAVYSFLLLRPEGEPGEDGEGADGLFRQLGTVFVGLMSNSPGGWSSAPLEGTYLVSHYETDSIEAAAVVLLESDSGVMRGIVDLTPCSSLLFENVEDGI